MRKPFFWAARKAWYVKIQKPNGKFSPKKLDADKDIAMAMWQDKYSSPALPVTEASVYTARGVVKLYVNNLVRRVKDGTLEAKTSKRWMADLASFYARKEMVNLLVTDLKRHHANRWLDAKESWNSTTKHHAAKTVKRAFKWAVDEGYIEKNPLVKFSRECGPPRQHCIDGDLHGEIMEGANDAKLGRKRVRCFRLVLTSLRLSGCRPSEVADMTIDRIDWEKKRWVWSEHKTARKTGSKRIVTCCPCLWTLTRIAARGRSSGPLFHSSPGTPWKYSMMRVRFERLKKRLELPEDCVLYSYRHASITEALKAGVDTATVAAMHGTSITMLERHYSHVIQDSDHLSQAAMTIAKSRQL